MNVDLLMQRASLLIEQRRYDLAEETLRQALTEAPGHAWAHAHLALCLAQDRDRLPGAELEAEQAILQAPDEPFSHYVMAAVRAERNNLTGAHEAIAEAIRLQPESADFHSLRASLFARQNKWKLALASADRGLSFDPDCDRCSGIRSLALERLGKVVDALGEADRAIQRDPDSADAHASRGWALLNQGNYRGAQVAFREALRLEPANEFSRSGMIMAINSGNFVFRWFSLAFNKLSRLDPRVQIGLFVGAWFLMRLLNQAAQANPAWQPWVLPILGFYLLVVLMSWIMQPLFNTALRFHPFGKFLLSRKEKWASNLIAGTLLFGLITGATAALLYFEPVLILLGLILAFQMTIPLAVAFGASAPWAQTLATLIACGFGLLFVVIMIGFLLNVGFEWVLTAFLMGVVFYSFVGQSLIAARPKY